MRYDREMLETLPGRETFEAEFSVRLAALAERAAAAGAPAESIYLCLMTVALTFGSRHGATIEGQARDLSTLAFRLEHDDDVSPRGRPHPH